MCDELQCASGEQDQEDLLDVLITVCDCPACGIEVLVAAKPDVLSSCPNCGQVFAFRNVFLNEVLLHNYSQDDQEEKNAEAK